jgi:hypothetical protein
MAADFRTLFDNGPEHFERTARLAAKKSKSPVPEDWASNPTKVRSEWLAAEALFERQNCAAEHGDQQDY